ncbi:MAG: glutathione peroxidase [Planctomycetota bacterium]|nr:glutathione peroxidase [Planctomycetota bacterium]
MRSPNRRAACERRSISDDCGWKTFAPPLFEQDLPTVIDRIVSLIAFTACACVLSATSVTADPTPKKDGSVLDFKVKDIDGKDVELSKFRGDVLLIVNTASQCGYTPQYAGLEDTYKKYKDLGFEVLAFPANEFGHQEPGSDAEIKSFCSSKFHTSFPLFSKIVVKGKGIHPLYQYLTSKDTNPKFAGDIPWNFAKFLVNRKGEVIARFAPGDDPESTKVVSAIEKALAEAK